MAVQTRTEVTPVRRRSFVQPLRLVADHPWLLTAVASLVLLLLPVTGGDLAAQEFYSSLFRADPLALWNNHWYGGHLLGGYSLLSPPLGAVLGARPAGAIAAVAAAGLGTVLFRRADPGLGGQVAAVWFAVGCLVPFVVGQMPFGVGLALGLAAVLAVTRERPRWAAIAALATSLTSPLAGAFLLLVALTWTADLGLRRTAPLAGAGAGLVVAAGFGGGGWFPFPTSALVSLLGFSGIGLVLVPRSWRTLRFGLVLYGVAAVGLYSVQNPVGGNVTRLAALIGGPLSALVLVSHRRWRALALLAVPLACWQLWPLATALSRSVADPSSGSSYYAGLSGFLRTQSPGAGRLEVPTMRQHWEAYYVARVFPLTRGWERQLDLRDNAPLYDGDLTADELHAWLVESGVGLVALPDAPLDYWARREAELIRTGQPWLTPVWSDKHWQVWRVADSPGLSTGPARVTRLGVDFFAVTMARPGAGVVRLHWNPFWHVESGTACLRRSPEGWTTVEATVPGEVEVSSQWSLTSALRQPDAVGRCS